MDGQGIALIITAFTGLIGACFAGYVAIHSLPAVHTLVNSRSKTQDEKIVLLERKIDQLQEAALIKFEEALAKSETQDKIE